MRSTISVIILRRFMSTEKEALKRQLVERVNSTIANLQTDKDPNYCLSNYLETVLKPELNSDDSSSKLSPQDMNKMLQILTDLQNNVLMKENALPSHVIGASGITADHADSVSAELLQRAEQL